MSMTSSVAEFSKNLFVRHAHSGTSCVYDPNNNGLLMMTDSNSALYILDPTISPTPGSSTLVHQAADDPLPNKRHAQIVVNGTCAAFLRRKKNCRDHNDSNEAAWRGALVFDGKWSLCAQEKIAARDKEFAQKIPRSTPIDKEKRKSASTI
ncbi:hypothetical protein CYMTET_44313 [Cymbomonas tetramitiformis]|uniref:Uncharacterized protein n=1 Tax=Cymbomonas tetramitiformis TaxID=36881 RepID=A0AAE0C0D3_9CHLO|nr:hypothetical protein CYMTET_44313 [Cymbomonas tetramitiformis]